MRKCRRCGEYKDSSEFKSYEKPGKKKYYAMTCNFCGEFAMWSREHFNGIETYYRHNKEYCDREVKRILDIIGIHNEEELLLKYKKKGSDEV